ncbi:MAG: hypothetical protein CV045_10635 [Cyanobacteria bacterium M5B4]|nr:MAG: hypothetical protein CV045_10635 [Cyanobacteria bacterium M5B4]
METIDIQTIHWTEIPGNKAIGEIHPLMLTPDGYTKKRTVTAGRGYHNREILVKFDRDYVKFRVNQILDKCKFATAEDKAQFLDELK